MDSLVQPSANQTQDNPVQTQINVPLKSLLKVSSEVLPAASQGFINLSAGLVVRPPAEAEQMRKTSVAAESLHKMGMMR